LNEEGEPYPYEADKQADQFPNDFHTAYATRAEAELASLELDQSNNIINELTR
jgi:hypothetical protein